MKKVPRQFDTILNVCVKTFLSGLHGILLSFLFFVFTKSSIQISLVKRYDEAKVPLNSFSGFQSNTLISTIGWISIFTAVT